MSNKSTAKVGEIFTEAGAAFNRLAEMTMMLHPLPELSSSVQSKTPVKRKAPEERQASGQVNNAAQQHAQASPISQQVTLNMLNVQEELECPQNGVKLEFEPVEEEVVT